MAEINKRNKEKWHSEYYHRYMDWRAISPALFIALIWDLAISLYIPRSAITQMLAEQAARAIQFPATYGVVFDVVFRAVIFVIDFAIVFLIVYFIFYVTWHEQDKKLIMKQKKRNVKL